MKHFYYIVIELKCLKYVILTVAIIWKGNVWNDHGSLPTILLLLDIHMSGV